MQGMKVSVQSCGEDTTAVRRALTSGLFQNAALRQPDGGVLTETSMYGLMDPICC